MTATIETKSYSRENPFGPGVITVSRKELVLFGAQGSYRLLTTRQNGRPLLESWNNGFGDYLAKVGAKLPEADQWESANEVADHFNNGYGWV